MSVNRRKIFSLLPELIFLLLVLGAFPLALLRMSGEKVPLFGEVRFFTFTELGVAALALLCWNFRRAVRLWREQLIFRMTAVAGALLVIAALIQQILYGGSADHLGVALFYAAVPLAAAVSAPELRRILPSAAGVMAFLLLLSGVMSENFTGLTGNWNWTQGLLLALLPGGFFLIKDPHISRKMIFGAYLMLLIAGAYFYPEELSRGALAAVIGTFLLFFLLKKIPQQARTYTAAGLFIAGVAAIVCVGAFCSFADSRIQLFRGATAMLEPYGGIGVGPERYFDFIAGYLPHEYFLSPFSAPHHPHPHNEILYIAGAFGIAGILLLGILFVAVLRNLPKGKPAVYWLPYWIFMVIFFCGQFDMTAAIVPGVFWMLTAAGIAIAPPARMQGTPKVFLWQKCVAAVLVLLALISGVTNFRATRLFREGRLQLLQNDDVKQALELYRRSIRIKPFKEPLYGCAEIMLHAENDPAGAMIFLSRLSDELGFYNYLHTNRMKAVALVNAKQLDAALKVMRQECINYPYSVINARLHLILLKTLRRPAGEIASAEAALENCCRLRGIPLKDAGKFTMTEDDMPLPGVRSSSVVARFRFPGITVELIAAVTLFFAALGVGGALLWRRRDTFIVELGCGIVACAFAGILLRGDLLITFLTLAAPGGVWLNWEKIRKHWKIIALFTLLMAVMAGNALLPPNSPEEQSWQIALLKNYGSHGFFLLPTDNPFASHPALPHAFLLTAFNWGGITLPRLMVLLLFGSGGAYICSRFVRRSKFAVLALASAALFAPLTLQMTRNFYGEFFIIIFAFAGVAVLLKENPDRYDMFLAGIFSGAAAAVGVSGAGVAAVLLILLLVRFPNWKNILYFLAGCVISAGFYYWRIWYFLGEIPRIDAGNTIGLPERIRQFGSGWLTTSFRPRLYHGITTGFQFPLLFILALTGSCVAAKKDPGRKVIWLWSGGALLILYAFWALGDFPLFLLLPVLLGAVLLTLAVVETFFPLYVRNIVAVFALLAAVITLMSQSGYVLHYYYCYRAAGAARKYPAGFASGHDSNYIRLINNVNKLPETAKIALLWETRTLYLSREVTLLAPRFHDSEQSFTPSPDEVIKLFRKFDYIVINMSQSDLANLPGYDEDAARLFSVIEELVARGKLTLLPETQNMIFRVETSAAGNASASSSSRPASPTNPDAAFLKDAGNPRPLR